MDNLTPSHYRRVAVESASPAGLVILLYDRLVVDLQQAIASMRSGSIESRCLHLKHGFQVLQQLQSMLNMEQGGAAAQSLCDFHNYAQAQMLQAQIRQSAEMLEQLIALVLQVRQAWQTVDAGHPRAEARQVSAGMSSPNAYAMTAEHNSSSAWTV